MDKQVWLESQCTDIEKVGASRFGTVKRGCTITGWKSVLYKKPKTYTWYHNDHAFAIAKVAIPAGTRIHWRADGSYRYAERVDGGQRQVFTAGKLRAEKAVVLEIKKSKKKEEVPKAFSSWNWSFFYKKGATVYSKGEGTNGCKKRSFSHSAQVCASGIHFFLTRIEAEEYARGN